MNWIYVFRVNSMGLSAIPRRVLSARIDRYEQGKVSSIKKEGLQ